jgi:hypothetical protein
MVPRVECTPRVHSSYHPLTYLLPSQISSLTLTPRGHMPRTPSDAGNPRRLLSRPREHVLPLQIQTLMPALPSSSEINSTGGRGPDFGTSVVRRGHPYNPGLTPKASPLRPHVLAKERLRLWRPLVGQSSLGSGLPMADGELVRILNVLSNAWAEGTAESYGSGLLSFHVFCDSKTVPEAVRAPASPSLVAGYISTFAGFLSGSTISNYVSGVRAWHILHGVPWSMNEPELEALLRAADRLTPSSSKRQARMPYTTDILCKLRPYFDLSVPLDASVSSVLVNVPRRRVHRKDTQIF